jgi:hypothetical protein
VTRASCGAVCWATCAAKRRDVRFSNSAWQQKRAPSADGRLVRNVAVGGIRLLRADDTISLFFVEAIFHDGDGAAYADLVARPAILDDLRTPQRIFQVFDAPFHERLLLLGIAIVGIFGEVALRNRRLQALGDFRTLDFRQVLQLLLHLLQAIFGYVDYILIIHDCHHSLFSLDSPGALKK